MKRAPSAAAGIVAIVAAPVVRAAIVVRAVTAAVVMGAVIAVRAVKTAITCPPSSSRTTDPPYMWSLLKGAAEQSAAPFLVLLAGLLGTMFGTLASFVDDFAMP